MSDEPQLGIRVTVTDLESGETESTVMVNDYIVVTAGDYYVAHYQHYPTKGTVVLTIKRDGGD